MKKKLLLFVGIVFVLIGLFGIRHSINATKAQVIYAKSRYAKGSKKLSPEEVYSNYIYAVNLYPYNFYFAAYAGEKIFYNLHNYKGQELEEKTEIVKDIAGDGIKINSYNSQLIYLHMRMLEKDSPWAALACWKKFVDWYFWNDYNHSVLAELYAKSGMYEKAMNELKYLEKNPKLLDHTKRLIDDAWLSEMKSKIPENIQKIPAE
jgi:hypothetical protein